VRITSVPVAPMDPRVLERAARIEAELGLILTPEARERLRLAEQQAIRVMLGLPEKP
jgi:hypothetical protein